MLEKQEELTAKIAKSRWLSGLRKGRKVQNYMALALRSYPPEVDFASSAVKKDVTNRNKT